jgi:hypothetical protein
MIFDFLSFVIGVLVGGAAAAASAKFLGWFQKQDASIAKKLP